MINCSDSGEDSGGDATQVQRAGRQLRSAIQERNVLAAQLWETTGNYKREKERADKWVALLYRGNSACLGNGARIPGDLSRVTELHGHGDKRWPTDVTSNKYFRVDELFVLLHRLSSYLSTGRGIQVGVGLGLGLRIRSRSGVGLA